MKSGFKRWPVIVVVIFLYVLLISVMYIKDGMEGSLIFNYGIVVRDRGLNFKHSAFITTENGIRSYATIAKTRKNDLRTDWSPNGTLTSSQATSPRDLDQPPLLILFWKSKSVDFFSGAMEKCKNPIDNASMCQASNDPSVATESDAIVFDPLWIDINEIPPEEGSSKGHPIRILLTKESPANLKNRGIGSNSFPNPNVAFWQRYINVLITYSSSLSDIPYPYGVRVVKTESGSGKILDFGEIRERKFIMAMISNCKSERRIRYILELKKSIPQMDLYGRCFNNTVCLPTQTTRVPPNMTSDVKDSTFTHPLSPNGTFFKTRRACTINLVSRYKFVIGIENSASCPDYITEKYWDMPLNHGVIPIVGGTSMESYRRSAIPHSYIHIEQFSDPRSLSQYLNTLNDNLHNHLKYLEWHKNWSMAFSNSNVWCELCHKVINIKKERQNGLYTFKKDMGDGSNTFVNWWNSCDSYY